MLGRAGSLLFQGHFPSSTPTDHAQPRRARREELLEDGQPAQSLLLLLPQDVRLGRRSAIFHCLGPCGFTCSPPCREGAVGMALPCQLYLAISSNGWWEATGDPAVTACPAHAFPCSSQSHKPPDLPLAPLKTIAPPNAQPSSFSWKHNSNGWWHLCCGTEPLEGAPRCH